MLDIKRIRENPDVLMKRRFRPSLSSSGFSLILLMSNMVGRPFKLVKFYLIPWYKTSGPAVSGHTYGDLRKKRNNSCKKSVLLLAILLDLCQNKRTLINPSCRRGPLFLARMYKGIIICVITDFLWQRPRNSRSSTSLSKISTSI